jgi:hypothetical protein
MKFFVQILSNDIFCSENRILDFLRNIIMNFIHVSAVHDNHGSLLIKFEPTG